MVVGGELSRIPPHSGEAPGILTGFKVSLNSVFRESIMGKSAIARSSSIRNDYRCSIEKNQSGKYCVRVRVQYPRHAWNLGVFFLASSFDRAMKKLSPSSRGMKRNSGSGEWIAPRTWASPRSSCRKLACNSTAASNFPAKPPACRSNPNAPCLPSLWDRFVVASPNWLSPPASFSPATNQHRWFSYQHVGRSPLECSGLAAVFTVLLTPRSFGFEFQVG